jgi:hypothetical protein
VLWKSRWPTHLFKRYLKTKNNGSTYQKYWRFKKRDNAA